MQNKPTISDIIESMEATCNDHATAVAAAEKAAERMRLLSGQFANEIERLKTAADTFETFSEKEAAARFGITADYLGKLRIRRNLPHVAFGRIIRYLPDHLKVICELFETNRIAKKRKDL